MGLGGFVPTIRVQSPLWIATLFSSCVTKPNLIPMTNITDMCLDHSFRPSPGISYQGVWVYKSELGQLYNPDLADILGRSDFIFLIYFFNVWTPNLWMFGQNTISCMRLHTSSTFASLLQAAVMEIDEHLKYTFLQFDPPPQQKENITLASVIQVVPICPPSVG